MQYVKLGPGGVIKKQCHNCTYWHKGTSQCRRHAPRHFPLTTTPAPWPCTEWGNYCGDFDYMTNTQLSAEREEA